MGPARDARRTLNVVRLEWGLWRPGIRDLWSSASARTGRPGCAATFAKGLRSGSNHDDDVPALVSFLHVAVSIANLRHAVAPINDRPHLPFREQIPQGSKVFWPARWERPADGHEGAVL